MNVTIYHNPACGTSRNVFILPSEQRGEFTKEDGQKVIDAAGQRLR